MIKLFGFASIHLRPIEEYGMLTEGRSARDLLRKKIRTLAARSKKKHEIPSAAAFSTSLASMKCFLPTFFNALLLTRLIGWLHTPRNSFQVYSQSFSARHHLGLVLDWIHFFDFNNQSNLEATI